MQLFIGAGADTDIFAAQRAADTVIQVQRLTDSFFFQDIYQDDICLLYTSDAADE